MALQFVKTSLAMGLEPFLASVSCTAWLETKPEGWWRAAALVRLPLIGLFVMPSSRHKKAKLRDAPTGAEAASPAK